MNMYVLQAFETLRSNHLKMQGHITETSDLQQNSRYNLKFRFSGDVDINSDYIISFFLSAAVIRLSVCS
jgi:hypothetical protein